MPIADEDVVRLDVAVQQPCRVRGVEGVAGLLHEAQRARCVQFARADQVGQGAPFHQPHGEKQLARRDLADLVDVEHVRVLDRGLEPRLPLEARDERGVLGELRSQDLQRDRALQRGLDRLVDDAHPAAAQHPLDLIAADRLAWLEHRRSPNRSSVAPDHLSPRKGDYRACGPRSSNTAAGVYCSESARQREPIVCGPQRPSAHRSHATSPPSVPSRPRITGEIPGL
jgi:hypothetical protein